MMAYILGLITAVAYAGQSLIGKQLSANFSPAGLVLVTFGSATPILFLLQLFFPFEIQHPTFFIVLLLSLVLNIIAWSCFYKALSLAQVGLVMPITAMTPIFIIPIEYFLYNKTVSVTGVMGMALSVLGIGFIYLPHLNKKEKISLKGIGYIVITTVVWSFSATLEKIAVKTSNPITYALLIHFLLTVFFLIYFYKYSNHDGHTGFKRHLILMILLGIVSVILAVSQYTAILITNVSLVIALKRSGILLAVIGGGTFFKETHLMARIVGSIIILSGIFLLYFAI
ncbi:MAG: hypothetical protein Kow00108_05110 [Calditrichia bacterium]